VTVAARPERVSDPVDCDGLYLRVVPPIACRGGDVRAHSRGGGSAWDWHLVAPALREHGHDAVAVDLPGEDETAGWEEYADAIVEADRLAAYAAETH
jgi:hypothetical protein